MQQPPSISFVHIGMAKCGSTFIQRGLFKPDPRIAFFGENGEDSSLDEITDELWMKEFGALQLPSAINDYRQRFQHDLSRVHNVRQAEVYGISNEDLCGHPLTGWHRYGTLDLIHELFGAVKIILILRHPLDYISSLYNQLIKQGNATHWVNLLRDKINVPGRSFVARLNYRELVDYLRLRFGDSNVLVLPLELVRDNESLFVRKLYDFLGLDVIHSPTDFHDPSHVNRSLSAPSLEIIRIGNYLGIPPGMIKRYLLKLERSVISKIVVRPRKIPNRWIYRLSPGLKDLLREENFIIWDGDLRKYNYRFDERRSPTCFLDMATKLIGRH